MTVSELKEKCDATITAGYGDSDIILCGDDNFYSLDAGFSSVVYNRESILFYDFIEDNGYDEDNVIVLN